jgi:hypothetical protein
MAEREGGGGSGFVGVIVGALLVAVVALGFVAYNGGFGGGQTADISIEAPDIQAPG